MSEWSGWGSDLAGMGRGLLVGRLCGMVKGGEWRAEGTLRAVMGESGIAEK